jgi:hypothetical protein
MLTYDERLEQRDLRQATMRYIESLPPSHQALLQAIADEYEKPPYALVAGAIERLIADWTRVAAPEEPRPPMVLKRRSA